MLQYGIISEINRNTGRARVFFDELEIVSDWLALPNSSTEWKNWAVKQQVAVLMHDDGENGEILHKVITEDDEVPSWVDENTEGYQFKDGTKVFYDNSTKKLTIDAGTTGEIIFKCSKLTVEGEIVANGEVSAMAITPATKVKLSTHFHPTTTGVSSTPTPGV